MFSYRNILKIINYLCRACGVSSASTSIGAAIALIVDKYASSGPTSITLEQAALGGFTVGSQYIISDWQSDLLYAVSATVLKPVSGSVTLMNGETLPAGVEPDTLFIDTGVIDYDISAISATALPITYPTNYLYENKIQFETIVSDGGIYPLNFMGVGVEGSYEGSFITNWIGTGGANSWVNVNDNIISCEGVNATNTVRFIIEFHRSQLNHAIPTPTLSTPSSSTDGITITAPFSNLMRDPTGNEADFTLTVNSSPATITSVALDSDQTKFIITTEVPIAFGDVSTLSIASGNIKNTWGGVLAEVIDQPITNNVPE